MSNTHAHVRTEFVGEIVEKNMAECLGKTPCDNGLQQQTTYDTDEEDDYDEFCEQFTFSVSFGCESFDFVGESFHKFSFLALVAYGRLLRVQWLLWTEFR